MSPMAARGEADEEREVWTSSDRAHEDRTEPLEPRALRSGESRRRPALDLEADLVRDETWLSMESTEERKKLATRCGIFAPPNDPCQWRGAWSAGCLGQGAWRRRRTAAGGCTPQQPRNASACALHAQMPPRRLVEDRMDQMMRCAGGE